MLVVLFSGCAIQALQAVFRVLARKRIMNNPFHALMPLMAIQWRVKSSVWQSRINSFRHMNMCQAQSVSPASLQRICAGISSYSPLHIPQCLKELLELDQFWILDRFCLVQFLTISNNDPVRDARRENNVDIPSVEELFLVIQLILT